MNSDYLATDCYRRKSDGWYWGDTLCNGADVATFSPHNYLWARDSKGLFRQNTRVKGADPQSVRVLNVLFAKDNKQVYYVMGVAKDIADVASFVVLDPGCYVGASGSQRPFGFARDEHNIYCHDFMSGKPKILKRANPSAFTRLEYGFARDDNRVWIESDVIKGADPASFQPINDLYSRDQRHVYYWEAMLPGADPASFKVVADVTGIDRSAVYFMRGVISEADPESYCVDPDDPRNGRDRFRAYSWGKPLQA